MTNEFKIGGRNRAKADKYLKLVKLRPCTICEKRTKHTTTLVEDNIFFEKCLKCNHSEFVNKGSKEVKLEQEEKAIKILKQQVNAYYGKYQLKGGKTNEKPKR